MKLSVILVSLLFVGCGDIEELNVDTDSDNGETVDEQSEKAGSGIDDTGGTSSASSDAGEHAGIYTIASVTANDSYNMYYYSVVGGSCGMELSHLSDFRYQIQEDNDCTMRDQFGDVFTWNDASEFIAILDKFGALVDAESIETSAGSDTGAALDFELRFTATRAIMKITKLVQGYEVEYTYEYKKQ